MEDLAIRNLTFSYPAALRPALDGVDLEIHPGEFILLCGASGSGKTTLLRHLKPALCPYGVRSGGVFLGNVPLEQLTPADQARRIGYVMQDPEAQMVTDKVWHELAFGLENLGLEPGVIRLRTAEMAGYFGIQDWFHRDVDRLSGGQKQFLALASVMAMQPEFLILDEPLGQLDPIAAANFLNTLRKINRELGTTILITEHRTEDIFPTADRVIVMEAGKICAQGTPRQVGRQLWQESSPLFGSLPAPARVFFRARGRGDCPLTVREGRNWLAERCAVSPPRRRELPEEQPVTGEAALTLREVWFRYERNAPDILQGVDLQIPQGCIFALMGGNGSGKSTALKTICGICRPYRGEIRVFGRKLSSYTGGSLFRGTLAMLPQAPGSLFVKKTLGDDLREMCPDAREIGETAELLQLTRLLDAHPADLSGGELQRAGLAKVLLTQPRLLLLDEPTKGMDCAFKAEFGSLLRRLRDGGMTILLVSHDVEFCAEYADLAGLFFDGRLLTADTPGRFFGANSFYTTAADRMSRGVFRGAVTQEKLLCLLEEEA